MGTKRLISIALNAYPTSGRFSKLVENLGSDLCCFYGMGIPRGERLPDMMKGHTKTTKIPSRFTGFILRPILKILHLPLYNVYWYNTRMLDIYCANKIARDDSQIVFTTPLFPLTVEKCKKAGKYVVVEAGNSEPEREYNRITSEYDKFGIRHKYIYGDKRFKQALLRSFDLADKMISISKVSYNTYIEAGFSENKLKLIPLTGTSLPVQPVELYKGKQKAFITTAFQNFIKGTHRLLLAWRKAHITDIPLIVAGRICEDMKEFIDKFGPFENVIFTGYINGSLTEFYKQYDAVGVMMSLSEGACRVIPEMLSFGFPMIVAPDATCDLIENGINGFIINTTDELGLCEKLQWFASDWERVHALRKNALDSASHRTMADYVFELANFLKQPESYV